MSSLKEGYEFYEKNIGAWKGSAISAEYVSDVEHEVQKLVEAGAKTITLGKRILRTETAPIMISSILMYELGDI